MTWYNRAAASKKQYPFFKSYVLPVLKWWVLTWAVAGGFAMGAFSVVYPILVLTHLLFG